MDILVLDAKAALAFKSVEGCMPALLPEMRARVGVVVENGVGNTFGHGIHVVISLPSAGRW